MGDPTGAACGTTSPGADAGVALEAPSSERPIAGDPPPPPRSSALHRTCGLCRGHRPAAPASAPAPAEPSKHGGPHTPIDGLMAELRARLLEALEEDEVSCSVAQLHGRRWPRAFSTSWRGDRR